MKLKELQEIVPSMSVYNETGYTYLFDVWSSENSYPDNIKKHFNCEVVWVYDYYGGLRCDIKTIEDFKK